MHAAPTAAKARNEKFSCTRCRTAPPPPPPPTTHHPSPPVVGSVIRSEVTASLSGLEDATGCGVSSSALLCHQYNLSGLGASSFRPYAPASTVPLPPPGSRSEPPRQVSRQDLQFHKPLALNYWALRGTLHAPCSDGCEYRCACKHVHATLFASAAGPASLWGMCF